MKDLRENIVLEIRHKFLSLKCLFCRKMGPVLSKVGEKILFIEII